MSTTTDEFIDVTAAGAILGYTTCTVAALARQGRIDGYRDGPPRRRWHLRRESVLAFVRPPSGKDKPKPKPPAPPRGPSELDLAVDRYEKARATLGAARTGSPEHRRASTAAVAAENALMRLLREHGKRHTRGRLAYESDGEELFRYQLPRSKP